MRSPSQPLSLFSETSLARYETMAEPATLAPTQAGNWNYSEGGEAKYERAQGAKENPRM